MQRLNVGKTVRSSRILGIVVGLVFMWATQWLACGPAGTKCTSDADCLNGFYCASTDKKSKLCVRRPQTKDGGAVDNGVQPEPRTTEFPVQPPTDRDSMGPDSLDASMPPEYPREGHVSKPDVSSPDRGQPPVEGCKPPPYNTSTDPGNGGKRVKMDALDSAFFKTLRVILYVSRHCHKTVWGGKFKMHEVPTYIVNVDSNAAGKSQGIRGFLIHHPNPPSSATLVDSKQVFGIPNVYAYDAAKNSITEPGFSFDLRLGGIPVYAFEYGSSDPFIDPTQDDDVFGFFVHEGFHRVQEFEEAWKQASGDQDTSRYPMHVDGMALALLEGRALIRGLSGMDPETALKFFYATQSERFKADKTGIYKAHDALQEWLEGTAQYAEELYMKAIAKPVQNSNINSIFGRLSMMEKLDGQISSKQDLLFSFTARFYGTGAAIGLLLDRLKDTTWKDKIRKGQTFHSILKQRFSSINTAHVMQQAKKQLHFPELLQMAQQYAKIK